MKAYRITTDKSDYPFLVIADNIYHAIEKLEKQSKEGIFPTNVTDCNIKNITVLNEYSSNIIV